MAGEPTCIIWSYPNGAQRGSGSGVTGIGARQSLVRRLRDVLRDDSIITDFDGSRCVSGRKFGVRG